MGYRWWSESLPITGIYSKLSGTDSTDHHLLNPTCLFTACLFTVAQLSPPHNRPMGYIITSVQVPKFSPGLQFVH